MKSVLHYISADLDASMSEPEFSSKQFYEEEVLYSGQVPEPVFPAPPPPLPHTRHSSWFNKLSPIKPKSGFTRDQIIEYYCSNGDVALWKLFAFGLIFLREQIDYN